MRMRWGVCSTAGEGDYGGLGASRGTGSFCVLRNVTEAKASAFGSASQSEGCKSAGSASAGSRSCRFLASHNAMGQTELVVWKTICLY